MWWLFQCSKAIVAPEEFVTLCPGSWIFPTSVFPWLCNVKCHVCIIPHFHTMAGQIVCAPYLLTNMPVVPSFLWSLKMLQVSRWKSNHTFPGLKSSSGSPWSWGKVQTLHVVYPALSDPELSDPALVFRFFLQHTPPYLIISSHIALLSGPGTNQAPSYLKAFTPTVPRA